MNTDAALVRDLLQTQRTLVLSTAGDEPWAAPVYFVYFQRRFWFFSSPRSRHIGEALSRDACAAAVFRDSADWRAIEGLQMSGRLAEVSSGSTATEAFAAYLAKFPTARDLLEGDTATAPVDLDAFKARLRSAFYALEAREALYLNNRAGFSARVSVTLPE